MNTDNLKNALLFKGIAPDELSSVLRCLKAETKYYQKGRFIFQNGENISSVGLVLSGSVHLEKEDYWGNKSLLMSVAPLEMFGEAYACTPDALLPINVIAAQASEILFMDIHRILTTCSSSCGFHKRLIENLVSAIAEKNILLSRKIDFVTQRSTKDKLLAYLSYQAQLAGASEFDIPFNQQQLADFLSVERSAMAVQLGRLKKDGIIEYKKKHFKLLG